MVQLRPLVRPHASLGDPGRNLAVTATMRTAGVTTDARGGTSTITLADVAPSNGVTHVIDTVLMP